MTQKFAYDVFLSYSSKDKPAVVELAERLKADGIRVWLDDWVIKLGDSIPIKISKGLEESRVLVLVISAASSEADWAKFESQTVLFNDPTNKDRRFIPLRLDDSSIPFNLRQFAYVDWRKREEDQYDGLLSAVREDKQIENTANIDEEKNLTEPVRIIEDHLGWVESVAISTDATYIVSGSGDQTVRTWEFTNGKCLKVLAGHSDIVRCVAISTDNKYIVSGSADKTVRIWEAASGKCLNVFEGHSAAIREVAIPTNGNFIVSGSYDETIRIWDIASGKCLKVLKGHSNYVLGVAISSDDEYIVSCSLDRTVRIWEVASGKCLKVLKGHSDAVEQVVISTNGKFIVSGSFDKTVRIWEIVSGKCLKILAGHSDIIYGVSILTEGEYIVSGSFDKTIRIWETASGKCLNVLEGHSDRVFGVTVSLDGNYIVSGSKDQTIRIWDISSFIKALKEPSTQILSKETENYEFYTNAKILLVGDSGVGKSGLAHRLTQNKFVETISTDGVWATQMNLKHDTSTHDTEREIWLWDFAGQSDYRLIHQLFMDETALAVLVFNPQSDNPFEGLGQWDRDLQKAARRPFKKLLVAGRCDRGSLTVSEKSLTDFKNEREFAHYLETSALTGAGCDDLREAIIKHIDWEAIPHRTSPRIFRLLKEEIIKLKDEGRVLFTLSELKQNLEMRLPKEKVTLDEVRTVAGLLAGTGVVWELKFGEYILLQPEKINAYAAAVIRSVRAHVKIVVNADHDFDI